MWKYVVHYILSSTFFLQLRTGILAPTFSCVTFQPYMLEVIILKEIYGFKIIVIQPIYGGWNLEISFNELIRMYFANSDVQFWHGLRCTECYNCFLVTVENS